MSEDIELVDVIECKATLGEGVIWDDVRDEVLWTDIEARALYRWDWNARELTRLGLQARLGSFALIEGENDWLLAASEKTLHLLSRSSGRTLGLANIEDGFHFTRLNDGRADRQGRFWVGSMAEQRPAADGSVGSLYCLDPGATEPRRLLTGIQISNSLCWSLDGARMYHADSPRNVINSFAFDAQSGSLGEAIELASTPPGIHPDGSCVDSAGYLWNAQWGASRVVRYSPEGRIDRVVDLPCSQPSCVAFGGPGMDFMFVTTARVDLSSDALANEPMAGDVLVYKTCFRGLPESRASRAFLASA